jgi:hypothetical protein
MCARLKGGRGEWNLEDSLKPVYLRIGGEAGTPSSDVMPYLLDDWGVLSGISVYRFSTSSKARPVSGLTRYGPKSEIVDGNSPSQTCCFSGGLHLESTHPHRTVVDRLRSGMHTTSNMTFPERGAQLESRVLEASHCLCPHDILLVKSPPRASARCRRMPSSERGDARRRRGRTNSRGR